MGAGWAVLALIGEVDRIVLAVAVVVVVAWVVGRLVSRLGQPSVLGEILAGILLGPSVLGAVLPVSEDLLFTPEAVEGLRSIAQLGLVLFMFLVGFEVDLSALRGNGRTAVLLSQVSTWVPVALGVAVSPIVASALMPRARQPGFALFVGAAMGITAFPVLARLLQQLGLDRTSPGVLAIACAAVGDVTAWGLLAATLAFVEASGASDLLVTGAAGIAFTAVVLGVLRPALRRLGTVPFPLAVALALLGAWATAFIGLHAIFGAFLVGLAMPRGDEVHGLVVHHLEEVTATILLPVFFAVAGLAVRLQALGGLDALVVTAVVVLVAVGAKVGAVTAAGRLIGMSPHDSTGVGILMNTRGLTEIVVLAAGLQLGIINQAVYTTMVVMALVTTFMTAPLLEHTGLADRWRRAEVTQ